MTPASPAAGDGGVERALERDNAGATGGAPSGQLRTLIDRLRPRYPRAAACVERWGEEPITAYAAALWRPSSAPARRPLEPRLVDALRGELRRTYAADPRIDAALAGLEAHGILATTAHIAPTYGPVFLGTELLLSLGAPAGVVPLVGVWTGLPFNNRSRPGCVTFNGDTAALIRPDTPTWRRVGQSRAARAEHGDQERWISLCSVRCQRHLVYRHPLPSLLGPTLADLQPAAAELLGPAGSAESFPEWSLRTCARVQARILDHPPLAVDLNRALAAYLVDALEDGDHPLSRALLDPGARAELRALFPDEAWFYGRRMGAKGERLVAVIPDGDALVGLDRALPLTAVALTQALKSGALCPGLLLTYAALVGLNGLTCLGGLRQSMYLPAMVARWRHLGWSATLATDDRRACLLLGRLLRDCGRPAHAVDLALEGRSAADLVPADASMAQLWGPLTELL